MRVGINGFGRIGRQAFRALLERHPEVEIVGINELVELEALAHLLRYDSNYGRFPGEVVVDGSTLIVNGRHIPTMSQRDWKMLPWGDLDAQVIVEATGVGTEREHAALHLDAGADRVLITAPAKNADLTIVMGVNHDRYQSGLHRIVSNASCTTNGLAPPLDTLHRVFGVQKGLMSTVHAYTASQALVDGPAADLREARSAAMSIIPTSTGAAKAIGLVIPELAGRMHGAAYRVPVPTVSIVEFVVHLARTTTAEDVTDALRQAAAGRLHGIMTVNDAPLVSVDLRGDQHSSIVEAASTMVIGDDLVKVAAWYDNEWGYACRVADATVHVAAGDS